jgi:hypothetical protein
MQNQKIKVLLLAADPVELGRIQLAEEFAQIKHKIVESEYRDFFHLEQEPAVKRSEFVQLLTRYQPDVVHFCGHGSSDGPIFLLGQDHTRLPLSASALKEVLQLFEGKVRLVVLNACFTRDEAEAIIEGISCAVVGTAGEISDAGAISFASQFYYALASGRTIEWAFNSAKARLSAEQVKGAQFELLAKSADSYNVPLLPGDLNSASWKSNAARQLETDQPETDPAGCVYVSSASSRMIDAQQVAAALRDRGIPLCEAALAPDLRLTGEEIRDVLGDSTTSGGLLLLTPEAVESHSVNGVELPLILERAKSAKGFSVVAAVFSNFDLGMAGANLQIARVPFLRLAEDKATPAAAARIAKLVLERRIARIHQSLPPAESLSIEIYTKVKPPLKAGTALRLDWRERFSPGLATPAVWEESLLPALRDVVQAIEQHAPGRAVQVDGRASLPAAIALGCGFIQPKNIDVRWSQHTVGRDQLWGLAADAKDSEIEVTVNGRHPGRGDLAVRVSITRSVEPAFEATRPGLPPFRAIVDAWKTPFRIDSIATAGQAKDAAFKIFEEVREATGNYPELGTIHLFMSVPAGLAMMIGQLLNVLGPVQTYDLVTADARGRYQPAALLMPST